VKSILPPPRKKYYLRLGSRLLAFQSGWSDLVELVGKDGKDDCIVLLPIAISGSAEATLLEPDTQRQTALTFQIRSEFIIAGRCAIYFPPQSKVVCVVLCVGRDKEQ
jgi:hypothetical protein